MVRRETERGRRLDRAFAEIAGTLPARERAFAHELAWGTTRLRGRLDAVLASFVSRPLSDVDAPVLELLRLGAYQILYMDSVPPYAGVSATVEQVRATVGGRPTGFVNAVLRKVAGAAPTAPDDPGSPEALTTWGSHPEWLVRRWLSRHSAEDVTRMVEANNRRPPTCLLPLNLETAAAIEVLAAHGIEADAAAPWSPCLRLADGASVRAALAALPVSIVQDPAANLVARYADVGSGTIVADLCAAPGGKALALTGRPSRIIAADRSESRIHMLKDNALRTGRPLDVVVADASCPPVADVDVVLLDAPCTGTGTLARHPDARWRLSPADVDAMAELQGRLLLAAADAVGPGGLLVYSTCTLEPEENEERVADFLRARSDFSIEPTEAVARTESGGFVHEDGTLRVEPWRSGYDGSFAARMRKAG